MIQYKSNKTMRELVDFCNNNSIKGEFIVTIVNTDHTYYLIWDDGE